jgi:hypothetical protein
MQNLLLILVLFPAVQQVNEVIVELQMQRDF